MELELWSEVSDAISAVAVKWPRHPRDQHSTATIVRVYHWACLHDRPVTWACQAGNWTPQTRPDILPDQSTMSRRMRRDDFESFLQHVGKRMNGKNKPAMVKVVVPAARRRRQARSEDCGIPLSRQNTETGSPLAS